MNNSENKNSSSKLEIKLFQNLEESEELVLESDEEKLLIELEKNVESHFSNP